MPRTRRPSARTRKRRRDDGRAEQVRCPHGPGHRGCGHGLPRVPHRTLRPVRRPRPERPRADQPERTVCRGPDELFQPAPDPRAPGHRARFRATPHMFRHTAATEWLEAHIAPDVVQQLLGHASQSTLAVYTHPTDAAARAAVDRVHEGRPR
ncbi:tyrosine-type recombinase/integrase [Janibacter melonis]|uniref:tyrosine-type recombinase/integrase n=1 Tax=Janibacter melonis TaxID=262209 RepID=UPI0035571ABF